MAEKIANDSDEMSLKDLILSLKSWRIYIFKRWYIILIFCVFGLGLALIYVNIKVPKYIAATSFVLDDKGSGGGGGQFSGLASLAGIDLGGGGAGIFEGENIIELYKSRIMIQSALLSQIDSGKSELLVDRYIAVNKIRQAWQKDKNLKSIKFSLNDHDLTRVKDSVLGRFVEDIRNNYLVVAKPDKKLSIINVSVKSKDEFFSEAFDRKIVETVNNFYSQTKNKKALQNLKILQRQADSVRRVFGTAIYNTAAANVAPNLNPTRQTLTVPGQKYQFNAEANKSILTQLIQNLEAAKINVRNETPLIQVIDSPVTPLPIDSANLQKSCLLGIFAGFFLSLLCLTFVRIYANIMAN